MECFRQRGERTLDPEKAATKYQKDVIPLQTHLGHSTFDSLGRNGSLLCFPQLDCYL
mgnify:CR=1 FL=1